MTASLDFKTEGSDARCDWDTSQFGQFFCRADKIICLPSQTLSSRISHVAEHLLKLCPSQDFHTDDRLIENQGHMHAGKIRCQVLFLISLLLHNSSFSCE